jgi:branched-chain amino acid transport system permease protein
VRRPSPRTARILLAAFALALLLFPLSGDRYWIALVTRMMSTAIFALSLDLLAGYTGLVSFGHAAFFGAGGYTLAVLGRYLGLTGLLATLPLSILAAGLLALGIGWLSIRTKGVYFIMITLAFAQMLFHVVQGSLALGGSDGIYLEERPIHDKTQLYYFTLLCLIASILFVRMILRAPFGRVIAAIRASEPRARALGYPTPRYRLASFIIAGALAGTAGWLSAAESGFMSPAHLAWHASGRVLVIVILGGVGTLYGPVIGAFLFMLLEELTGSLTEHALLFIGAFVIAVVLLLPQGIAGLFAGGRRG